MNSAALTPDHVKLHRNPRSQTPARILEVTVLPAAARLGEACQTYTGSLWQAPRLGRSVKGFPTGHS